MAENDVLKMKVADLKRELKIRGLLTTGNKNELQERLQTAMLDGDLTLEDPSIGEDLLDDALTDDEDKGLDLSNEDAVLQSPDKDEDKSLETTLAAEQSQQPQKKVVLKRKVSISLPSSTSDATNTPTLTDDQSGEKIAKITAPSDDSSTDDKQADGAKTVIKLSEMSMKDRMEMRAKKFGTSSSASTTPDTKAAARAARFGQTITAKSESDSSAAISSTAQPAASLEMLKKRAERFGCSVSSKMVDLERKEKLLKRQERFGEGADETKKSITTTTTATTTTAETSPNGTTVSSSDYAEKAKQRLERFKPVVK